MVIGICRLELDLHGVQSLKAKRSLLKSLMAQVKKKFNVAIAEVDLHDLWQSSTLGLSVVSTDAGHAEAMLENVVHWIETYRPDVFILDHYIETVRL